ncbi:MAG: 50S ribosomal protein L25 [Planctomycetota bacterium]|nr:50S ribosomal protein L25 [Planctomycetota bacterium]
MKTVPLKARRRSEKGTRACRRLRRAGEIPINLYGRHGEGEHQNLELAASAYDVMQLLGKHASFLDVTFEGKTEMAVMREVQRDAFGDDVLHVDLVMIDPTKPVELAVDIVVRGEAKGQKSGGRLLVELRQLHASAIPSKMPTEIVAKVDDLDINGVLTVGQLELPEGVTVAEESDQIVVHVLPPLSEEELAAQSTAATAAAGEPEVIGKKKDEEGEAE